MKFISVREVSTLLKQGSSGAAVVTLQKKLHERNFNLGSIDGIFGIGTKKALITFQKSVGLTPDGIAGSSTWAALNAKKIERTVDTGLFTVDAVSQIFYDAPRRNIEKYLPAVLKSLEKLDLGDREMILMALALFCHIPRIRL